MSITLSQILLSARRSGALLTSDTAAYMVLSLAEQSQAKPRRVSAKDVVLHPGGAITIEDAPPSSDVDCDASLRQVLGALVACTSPVTLSDALGQIVQGQSKSPALLREELQTALVPLNRSAARRAMSRLYRRLTANPDGEAVAASAAPLGESQAPNVTRRDRRRSPASTAEDIPIAIDETAFRHVAYQVKDAPNAPRDAGDVHLSQASTESLRVSWYPAQTTPRQFHDRTFPSAEDGTPILGSLAVREAEMTMSEAADCVIDVSARTPTPSAEVVDVDVHSDDWSDTVVEAVVAEAGGGERLTMHRVSRRNPRRSAVSQLVERIPASGPPLEQVRTTLLQMVNTPSDEQGFSPLGTVTPPPVVGNSAPAPFGQARRSPRRIVLSAMVAGCAGVFGWLMRPGETTTADVVVAASPAECHAEVHVEVPTNAKVFLNDARERAAKSGPLARFEHVDCQSPAELTVQLPNPPGSPLPDAWVRMPLPEAELRAAAQAAVPFFVAPLGEVR